MRSIFSSLYLVAVVSSVFSVTASAAALPGSGDLVQLAKRAPPYPDDAEIKAAFIKGSGPAVFFSNLDKATILAPRKFSKEVGGAFFKTIFQKQANGQAFDDPRPKPAGSNLTPEDEANLYRDFGNRFSRIMAEQAEGPDAFVLLRALDGPNGPKSTSTWTKLEEGALRNNPSIKRIIRVNPSDFTDRTPIFERPGTPPPGSPKPATPKRGVTGDLEGEDEHTFQPRGEIFFDDHEEEPKLVERALPKAPTKAPTKPLPVPSKAQPAPVKPTTKATIPVQQPTKAPQTTLKPQPTPSKVASPVAKPTTTTAGKAASTPLLKFDLDWNDPKIGAPKDM